MREIKINNNSEAISLIGRRTVLLCTPRGREPLSDKEYADAKELFSEQGYSLMYLPKLMRSIPQELVDYFVPETNGQALLPYDAVQERILGKLGLPLTAPVAIIDDDWEIVALQAEEGDEDDFLRQILKRLGKFGILCESSPIYCEKEIRRLPNFSIISHSLVSPRPSVARSDEEIRMDDLIFELQMVKLRKLAELGLSERVLRFILDYPQPKLSRLRVTSNSRIILEDYSAGEIKMDDKTKALYLLYLRHTEGIAIKDLGDHTNELMDLYQSISGRDDPEAMKRTIDNLANPLRNDPNISLSRIKKAFCEVLAPQIASSYYVAGERGGARSIALDRGLVTWETIR